MKKQNISLHELLLRAAGVIFLLTMISLWLVCGLLARYTKESRSADGARVAAFGSIEVKEHYAALKEVGGADINDVYYGGDFDDMVYALGDSEVDGNTYDVVMPGVDIPKDTFVRVYPAEVDCELYIEVVEKEFPATVTYAVDTKYWEKDESQKSSNGGDVYKYKGVIEAGSGEQKIDILSGNRLTVSQYYDADSYREIDENFSMEFYAWMVQKN